MSFETSGGQGTVSFTIPKGTTNNYTIFTTPATPNFMYDITVQMLCGKLGSHSDSYSSMFSEVRLAGSVGGENAGIGTGDYPVMFNVLLGPNSSLVIPIAHVNASATEDGSVVCDYTYLGIKFS